jgi:hypothetical protein
VAALAANGCDSKNDHALAYKRVDDDNTLRDAVERNGDAIAAMVPGRKNSQCCKRWQYASDTRTDRYATQLLQILEIRMLEVL